MAGKVHKLKREDIRLIEEEHKRLFFRGTPEKFYTDSGFWEYIKHVKTKDEHDPRNPYKPFPIHFVYLQVLFLHMLNLDILFVPKSRQIRLTWAMAAFMSWFARTAKGQQILLQSKKEDDANEVVSAGRAAPGVGRIDCIEQQLPPHLRDPNLVGGTGNQVGLLTYSPKEKHDNGVKLLWSGSRIKALPQGADQVASRTGSFYGADEAAFLEDFAETWERVAPAMQGAPGDTKMFAWSSVYGGSQFNDYVLETEEDLPPGTPPPMPENTGIPGLEGLYKTFPGGRLPKGMRSWVTPSGLPVLEIHYSADPEKDPATDVGKQWLEESSRRYVGGVKSPRWRREMEIDYEATTGDLVFEHMSDPETPVIVPEMDYREVRRRKLTLHAGYDYGTRNPSSLGIWAECPETGDKWKLWELHEPCTDYKEHCRKIKACPYIETRRVGTIYCDQSMRNRTQQTEAGLKSVLELFAEEGVHMVPGRKGADLTWVAMLKANWGNHGEKAARWAEEDAEGDRIEAQGKPRPKRKPRIYICSNCYNTIREYKNLKWDAHTSQAVSLRRNAPEKIMDKNNHSFDADAYVQDASPAGVKLRKGSGGWTLADYRAEMARAEQARKRRARYVG